MTLEAEQLRIAAENSIYTTNQGLTNRSHALLDAAKQFFVGHTAAVGALFIDGAMKYPMYIKSGIEGGPWGGAHRGGIPRGKGRSFTSGGPSQGNIATHVEGHASAILWQRNIKRAHLLVDRAMCKVCHQNLYNTLPAGSILFVYSDTEGKTILRATHSA